ncbi:hypothetical protein LTR27_008410 [Elasticomyces elasticus]|nr:hypothetical protein LTR27_008410 [Elasticomyces elasticus]
MEYPQQFHVLIVGGGTCGLALAHGLKGLEGVRCTVFERDSEEDYFNKTRDWGMMLHWGKDWLFRSLPPDLQDRFAETLCDPSYQGTQPIPHVNGQTGDVISTVEVPGLVRVSRKKLRNFLSSKRDLNIQFGKRLVSIATTAQNVTATFEDGYQESSNLIVGCDGSRSKVRELLVGRTLARPVDTGMTIINIAAACYTAEQALLMRKYHPISTCFYDPLVNGIFLLTILDASDKDNPENWALQVHHAWWGPPFAAELSDPKARLQFFKDRSSRVCEPFSTAAAALPDDTIIPVDAGQQWSPIPWNNRGGMVTIAGDAAHSMLPSKEPIQTYFISVSQTDLYLADRGQGLNNALQDATELVGAIQSVVDGRLCSQEALDGYDKQMQFRGATDVALSLETAKNLVVSDLLESPMFKVGLQKMEGKGIAV